jgi:hypothetical protein
VDARDPNVKRQLEPIRLGSAPMLFIAAPNIPEKSWP